MFHLAYLFFLFTFSFSVGGSFGGAIQNLISFLPFLLLTSIVFFINHLISFVYYYKKEISVEADFWVIHKFMSLMFKPYIRIVPMHLTIIFGGAMLFLGFNQIVLVLFLLLKTFVDLKMHANEHSQN
jgi:hypothetical protein